jgi:hypothetical protein
MWSVALFGYHKWKYELREIKQTLVNLPTGINYQGIMQYKEVLVNLVVSRHVDPPVNYDKSKYFIYSCIGCNGRIVPGDIDDFKPIEKNHVWTPHERKSRLIVTIDGPTENQMRALCEPIWDMNSYPILPEPFDWEDYGEDSIMLEPKNHIKKRRFNITLPALENMGVDIEKMLDKELIYNPELRVIEKTEMFDKLNNRNILESDGLNLLPPIIIEKP